MRLFLITSCPSIAHFAVTNNVDRIFIDLETLGKAERQGHLDTLKSQHSIADIVSVREAIGAATLMVRTNPIHQNSSIEIDAAISAGADILMLPMFRSIEEVTSFASMVNGRASISLLVETAAAVSILRESISVPGVDEVHIGLNDLTLDQGLTFMFEPLFNGEVAAMAEILRDAAVPFGIGGIARIGEGMLPAERILAEHVRLGSSAAILSRTFHRQASSVDEIKSSMDFGLEVSQLKKSYADSSELSKSALELNRSKSAKIVSSIVADMRTKNRKTV
ncbi:MAG: aldolase/citrate lyase family protein [Sphingorhabdus sp.]